MEAQAGNRPEIEPAHLLLVGPYKPCDLDPEQFFAAQPRVDARRPLHSLHRDRNHPQRMMKHS